MHKIDDIKTITYKKIITCVVALFTMVLCLLPMDDLPIWNGTVPAHRNQYELMAESILNGRVDFAYGDEAELDKLQNPYDPIERKESKVKFHWDHAYYNGHYYMYFGVVPVFLAFLPYRVITGSPLTTFRATQFFTVIIIAGIFTLFWLLSKKFFDKLKFGLYLSLSVAFSAISIWYAVAEPALYCTAITAAIALEVWSIYFYIKAVYFENNENRQILLAALGALLGALSFGCRPPMAFANIVVIPLLITFLKKRTFNLKLFGKLTLAALPYVLVAVGLMIYNYKRFDNPFEFGQAYQLTLADQSNYNFSINGAQMLRIIKESAGCFFGFNGFTSTFPYLKVNGVFFNFPILLFVVAGAFPTVRKKLKTENISSFLLGLYIAVIVITALDVLWSPIFLERYRMDIYFLIVIGCFITLGMWYEECKNKRALSTLIYIFSAITIICAFLYYVRMVGYYYPEKFNNFLFN